MHYSNQAQTAQLNNRIILQKYVTVTNDNDFSIKEWQDYKPIWAAAKNLHGEEYYAAGEEQSKKTAIFTIRYRRDIDESMRIKFGKRIVDEKEIDRIYEITFIDDIKYQREFMEIKVLEIFPE
ncbi:phage head closure protein [Clostridium kluyveri]|uniref:Predicted bacteriophage head-tail adaptor n=2 Tax=Clostridium kluyveri TaxID=1534 RepID=A5F9K3_CLOK5|nr:phage head closure protein [Clostridium kluyveri]ABQ23662.1 predicted bacteriophage head-tail adaptor [Clostridium kluyveri DSM 555]BAH08569.1 hypothetical protein CKR_P50 [Clostridium kluyveri NBRC 12016]